MLVLFGLTRRITGEVIRQQPRLTFLSEMVLNGLLILKARGYSHASRDNSHVHKCAVSDCYAP